MAYLDKHRIDLDTDACICGGEWQYFEDEHTHGCEVAGPPTDVVLDTNGRVVDDEDQAGWTVTHWAL